MSNAASAYAKALFEVARSEGETERVSDELFRIARAFEANNDLRQTLTDIAVPMERKEALLDDLLGKRVSLHTLNLAKFVVGQGRTKQLVEITDELARLAEEESRREVAVVRSAVELDEDQKTRLVAGLENATGKIISLKVIIDKSLIGGLSATVGDIVIDGSISSKLTSLKQHLGV